jgi:lipopolysaccharide/colanic/teichoic acid biosynthesis glycosyltransferase
MRGVKLEQIGPQRVFAYSPPVLAPAQHERSWRFEVGKRAFDVVGATLMLLVALPLIAAVALAIKADSRGAVLFAQVRTGRHGRRFRMYKFRTMESGADLRKASLAAMSHLAPPDFKLRLDPRVTRVGAWLRAWSLDELPNLLNVLLGDMSLVGPRPTSWGPDHYRPEQLLALQVRPGVTGLWQVSGRADLPLRAREQLDRQYVLNRSLALDLLILLRTIGAVCSRSGAY